MNWETIEGKWHQAKGLLREKWAKLTDDDIALIDGKRERLSGKIQERYGMAKDRAEAAIDAWVESFDAHSREKERPRPAARD